MTNTTTSSNRIAELIASSSSLSYIREHLLRPPKPDQSPSIQNRNLIRIADRLDAMRNADDRAFCKIFLDHRSHEPVGLGVDVAGCFV